MWTREGAKEWKPKPRGKCKAEAKAEAQTKITDFFKLRESEPSESE